MSAGDPLARIHAFLREFDRRCAHLVEETSFGTAFLNPEFPLKYDANLIRVERRLSGVAADSLAADADRVLGEHGLAHRKVVVIDDGNGARLATEFLQLGWSAERLLIMAQAREPEARPPWPVEEMHLVDVRKFLQTVLLRQQHGETDESVRQLVDIREVYVRAMGARFFVASVESRPASVCELYELDGVAQIEDVNTLEEFRGRGLASAVVLGASRSARDRGADLVFLVADDADWPKDLYGRLGFDPLGTFWSFVRAS